MPDAISYPATRAARGVPSSFTPQPDVAAGGGPTTRILSFRLANLVVNTRSSRSFGPFVGPAIIQSIEYAPDNAVANASATLGLGLSGTVINEDDVAMATVKGWSPIIEQAIHDSPEPPTTNEGFYQATTGTAEGLHRRPLNYIVNQPQFFLVVTAYAPAAAGDRWIGSIVVLEGVSQAALANFR